MEPKRWARLFIQQKIAEYSPDDHVIYVARNVDGQALFGGIASELGKAALNREPEYDHDGFTALCASQILCARYQIPMTELSDIPNEIKENDVDRKREIMSVVRLTAVDTMERIDNNLQAERIRQRAEQDRGAR